MSGAADWAAALAARSRAQARILFARLGVVAACRALTAGELAECLDMGGEKGARYALYLSCQQLREAGEQLRLRGEAASPFDITEGLAFADIMAAAAIIVRLSGGGEAQIRLLEDEEADSTAIEAGMGAEAIPAAPAGVAARGIEDLVWALGGEEEANGSRYVAGIVADDAFFAGYPARNGAPAATRPASGNGAAARRGLGAAIDLGQGAEAQADVFARILADKLRDASGNI